MANGCVSSLCDHLQAQAAGVTLLYKTIDLMPDILNRINVEVDVPKISQVLRTLVYNAIRFTPRGGKVTVSCSYVERNQVRSATSEQSDLSKDDLCEGKIDKIRVEVRDTGQGMSKVDVERLW
jgi:signal transduction histidine kinase